MFVLSPLMALWFHRSAPVPRSGGEGVWTGTEWQRLSRLNQNHTMVHRYGTVLPELVSHLISAFLLGFAVDTGGDAGNMVICDGWAFLP